MQQPQKGAVNKESTGSASNGYITVSHADLLKFEKRAEDTDKRIKQLENQVAQMGQGNASSKQSQQGGGGRVDEAFKTALLAKLRMVLAEAQMAMKEVRQTGNGGSKKGPSKSLEDENAQLKKQVLALQAQVSSLMQQNPDMIPRRQPLDIDDE